MKIYMRIIRSALLAFLSLVLLSSAVLAVYSYYANFQVQETDGTAHTYLPIIANVDNDYLASNGYISLTGLDTRVLSGGAELKHMVADDKTLFVTPSVPANSTSNYKYTLDNTSPLSSFPTITGSNGYYWTADVPALEPGNNFTIDQSGYIDTTSYYGNKKLVYKSEAFVVRESSAGNITAGIISAETYQITTTNDDTYRSVDISNYVMPDATGVILEVVSANGTPYNSAFRKTGSTDDRYELCTHIWVAVGLDSTQSFDYKLANDNLDVYLRGYTEGSSYWVFNTNAVDKSMTATGAWTDVDVSANVPVGTDGVIIEVLNTGAVTSVGLRMNGSGDNRSNNIVLNNHFWTIIGVDSNRVFEGWIGAVTVDFFLVGYIIDGTTFKLNATDVSLASDATWTDMNLAASAPNGKFAIIENIATGTDFIYGYRRQGITGAADSLYREMDSNHVWSVVELDHNQIVEGEISHVNFDSFLVGYVTSGVRHCDTVTYTYSASLTAAVTPEEHEIDVSEEPALDFDGINDYITCGAVLTPGEYTFDFWLRTSHAAGSVGLLDFRNGSNWTNFSLIGTIPLLILSTDGDNSQYFTDVSALYLDGKWHYWELYIAGSAQLDIHNCYLKIDGNTIAKGAIDHSGPTTAWGTFQIGQSHYGLIAGSMSEVCAYNRALTPVESTYNYNHPLPYSTAGMVGWWKLDEGVGAVAADSSGNVNHGAITGAVWATTDYPFKLFVDDTLKDIDDGEDVSGNDCAWEAAQGNVLPYVSYDKRYAAGSLVAWYQPISMIVGNNLDDREGTDLGETGTAEEDATIVWGNNVSGIGVSVSSLIPSSQPVPTAPAGEQPVDIVPGGYVPSGGTVNTVALQNNPLYPIVHILADLLPFTEEQIWFIGATFFIFILMGLAAFKVPDHLLLTGIVGLVLCGFFIALYIYQWWMLLIFVPMFIVSILMERKPVI